MKPIRSQVLVKPFPSDEISTGGIFVPLSAREVSNKVLIMDTGIGTKDRPMYLKKGQTGFRVKDWGCEVEVGGERMYLMDQDAILAVS